MPSLEPERMFRPREMMPVEVMLRVWPRSVRAGKTLLAVAASCGGKSAGRTVRVKSAPAVRSTRDEGKKRSEVIELR